MTGRKDGREREPSRVLRGPRFSPAFEAQRREPTLLMNYISIAGSLGLRSGRTKKKNLSRSVRDERLVGAARCPAAELGRWGAGDCGEAARKASTSNRRRGDLSQITQTLSQLGHQHRSGRLTRSHVPSTTAELATGPSISPLFSPSTREPPQRERPTTWKQA